MFIDVIHVILRNLNNKFSGPIDKEPADRSGNRPIGLGTSSQNAPEPADRRGSRAAYGGLQTARAASGGLQRARTASGGQ